MKLLTKNQCYEQRLCKQDLVTTLYPDETFDYALPQDWLNKLADQCGEGSYEVLRSGLVTVYPNNGIMGGLAPLTLDAKELLDSLVESNQLGMTEDKRFYI